MPWEETEEYIRSGHRDPEGFEPGSFRTITLSEEEGLKAVVAKPKGSDRFEVVSYLFSKAAGWTLEKAQRWFEERGAKQHAFNWLPPQLRAIDGERLQLVYGTAAVAGVQGRSGDIITREDLVRGARSLRGQPIDIDHLAELPPSYRERYPGLDRPYPVGYVLDAEEEDGRLEFVGRLVNPMAWELLKAGAFKGCSVVQLPRLCRQSGGGDICEGSTFLGVSLVLEGEPDFPETFVAPYTGPLPLLEQEGSSYKGLLILNRNEIAQQIGHHRPYTGPTGEAVPKSRGAITPGGPPRSLGKGEPRLPTPPLEAGLSAPPSGLIVAETSDNTTPERPVCPHLATFREILRVLPSEEVLPPLIGRRQVRELIRRVRGLAEAELVEG
jgi:hypothetical protein